MAALQAGTIGIGPDATLGCPITTALEIWMRYSVQPAAIAYFGMPVVEIKQISAYACRTRNNQRGAELSEHAFGNAIDIAGFVLANGRTVVVKSGWRGKRGRAGLPPRDLRHRLQVVQHHARPRRRLSLRPYSTSISPATARPARTSTASRTGWPPPPARPPYDGDRYAAIPGQPRYELMMNAYMEEPDRPKMPDTVLMTPVPPSYADSPFFTKGGPAPEEAGDDVIDE